LRSKSLVSFYLIPILLCWIDSLEPPESKYMFCYCLLNSKISSFIFKLFTYFKYFTILIWVLPHAPRKWTKTEYQCRSRVDQRLYKLIGWTMIPSQDFSTNSDLYSKRYILH
jgi:hypothetical protein